MVQKLFPHKRSISAEERKELRKQGKDWWNVPRMIRLKWKKKEEVPNLTSEGFVTPEDSSNNSPVIPVVHKPVRRRRVKKEE